MSDIADLIGRMERAEKSDRDIDHALAFMAGIGTDLERAFYAEKGDAAFVADQHRLTPMDYKNGDIVRQEWVKGTRRNPGGYKPRLWLNCNGARPLTSCPAYTGSLDATLSLVERALPGVYVKLEVDCSSPSKGSHAEITNANEDELGWSGWRKNWPPSMSLCLALLKAIQAKETQ